MQEIRIVRSRRKTIAGYVTKDGVEIRAPYLCPRSTIERFIKAHETWIYQELKKQEAEDRVVAEMGILTEAELKELIKAAKKTIPERVAYYANLMGATYGRVTIRSQKSRWGSCSSKGNLNFNCLLMLTPPEVLDSVVVHELCHLKNMNHSAAFYKDVRRYYPEYDKWNGWLKKNGNILLKRLPQSDK